MGRRVLKNSRKKMHFHHDTNCDKKFHVFYGVKSDLKLAQKCVEKYANYKKKE